METQHMRNERLLRRLRAEEERRRRWNAVMAGIGDGFLVGAAILLAVVMWMAAARAKEAAEPEAAVIHRNHAAVLTLPAACPVEPIPEILPAEGKAPDAIEVLAPKLAAKAAEPVPAEDPKLISQGTFKITFYCPCRRCSGRWGHRTSSGATCTEGRTVATDYFPAGTEIYIEGFGYRTVEDTGVHGRHLDVFLEDHATCLDDAHGTKKREVYLVKR